MNGKYSDKKLKTVVIIICAAVIAAIAVLCVFLFINLNSSSNTQPTEQTLQTAQSTGSQTQPDMGQTSETTLPPDDSSAEIKETQKVVVPTNNNISDKVYYFSKTFSPYKAIDSETGDPCPLKEVFGSSYAGGSISFNNDGTFSDTLSISSVNSGAYAVQGDTIKATYTNDKNVSVNIVQWNGDVPAEISINYGGYDVYFN